MQAHHLSNFAVCTVALTFVARSTDHRFLIYAGICRAGIVSPRVQAQNKFNIPGLPAGSQFVLMGIYLVLAYAVGAPKMYTYMLKARRKQLQKPSEMKSVSTKKQS
jgi:Protein tyrosine phosphatase-like protein, PTPLA